MKKNTASQAIGAQMITAADGTEFTGAVTVYVTGDAGTQAAGSVGSGACTHEGHGYHTYAPAQAETNYDLIAFTFVGTGAITATVQVATDFPQTGDAFGRLGAPAGASVSADVAAVKVDTAAVKVKTDYLPSVIAGGAGGVFIAGANAATSVTTALTANITGNLSGTVGKSAMSLAAADVTGNLAADVQTIKAQAVTCAAPVTVLASVGTAATSTAQTGDAFAVVKSGGTGDNAAIKTQTDKLAFTVTNKVDANVYTWNGAAVATPAAAGTPEVNVKAINNVATTPVTTVKAVQGLTTADTVTAGTVSDKTGYGIGVGGMAASAFAAGAIDAAAIAADALGASELAADAANEIADALLDRANGIETGLTLRQASRLMTAALAGVLSGAATAQVTIQNVGTGKNRIVMTVDANGNRSAPTYDLT